MRHFCQTFALLLSFTLVTYAQEPGTPKAAEPGKDYPSQNELRMRYGFDQWKGKTGPVWAGLETKALQWQGWSPLSAKPFREVFEVREQNPYQETPFIDHGVRVHYQMTHEGKELRRHHYRVEVCFTRSRVAARTLLLNQFLSHHSLPALGAPQLPWGEELVESLGDVAFAHHQGDLTHRVVFVRGNIFIRIDALGDATRTTLSLARSIDGSIQKTEQRESYGALTLPQPLVFETSDQELAPGEGTLLNVQIAPTHHLLWLLPHGDLVQDLKTPGDLGYLPRESGELIGVVIDQRGCFSLNERLINLP